MRCLHALVVCAAVGCGSAASEPVPTPGTPPPPGTTDAPPPATGTGAPTEPPAPAPAAAKLATLLQSRDRLIDTLAVQKQTTRCPLWNDLTETQRGVFLTITDLLGKRSFLTNDPVGGQQRAGADLETALAHVTKVYDVRDSGGKNGGAGNRIWLQLDGQLMAALRNVDGALPEWSTTTDFAGPHDPFDASSETIAGQPRGQAHFWSNDAKAVALGRPGVETVNDPHVVEIDIDYNLVHDSNPEGTYFPNGRGRDYYAKVWTPKGTGGSPELDYIPTGCAN